MNTTVVIPTYNECETIERLLTAVAEALPQASILVVDDASPDGTGALVTAFAEEHPQVQLLARAGKEGLGPAYVAGFRRALDQGAERVIQMDADFSHRPRYLPALAEAVATGADLALGSRYVPGGGTENWSWVRRLTSRGGSAYASLVLGLGIRDATGGFRCWRANLLAGVIARPLVLRQFGFQLETLYRARLLGATIREVPIVFPDRTEGLSKMNARIAWEALLGVWRLRFGRRRLVDRPDS